MLEKTTKGDAVVAESCLEFVEASADDTHARYETVLGRDAVDRLVDDIRDYDQLLASGEWVNRPCNFKPFKGETECPYCKLARIYTDVA